MSELIRLHWHGANGGPGLALDAVRQTAIAHEDLDPDYARQLAAEAIRTADIDFPRWYA